MPNFETAQPKQRASVRSVIRLSIIIAIVASGLVAACRDAAPTEQAIAVHARGANICTLYPGGNNCACRDDPTSYLCFADDSLPAIADDSFSVQCFQDDQHRGSQVRCDGFFGTPRPYSVIERTVSGKGFGFIYTDTTSVPIDSLRYRWYGTAIASSNISIKVLYHDSLGRPHRPRGKASFTILPRSTNDPDFLGPREVDDTLVPNLFTDYPYSYTDTTHTLAGATWGLYIGPLNPINGVDVRDTQFVVARGRGPSDSLFYWTAWPRLADSSISYIHPALSGGFGYPGASYWYSEQTGPQPGICNQSAGVAKILSETQRHEGATSAPDSHFGKMQAFVRRESVAVHMEKIYTKDSTALFDSNQSVIASYQAKLKVIQANFDSTDEPRIFGDQITTFGRIRCKIAIDLVYIDTAGGSHP